MHVTLHHIETHSPTIKTFWFQTDHMPHYTAGQFIELTLPQVPQPERNHRWFTLSSSPTEELLGITTTFRSSDSSVFKSTLLHLAPGDPAIMSEPMGDFVLPMQQKVPLLFVAAGMGITPVRSIAKWLLDTQQQRSVKLIYAARTPEDLAFADLLDQANFSPTPMVSVPSPDWPGETGRLTTERILREYTPGGFLYISGPERMTEQLVHDLRDRQFPGSKLVTDYFPGYEPV